MRGEVSTATAVSGGSSGNGSGRPGPAGWRGLGPYPSMPRSRTLAATGRRPHQSISAAPADLAPVRVRSRR
jgi:hypothetical protein